MLLTTKEELFELKKSSGLSWKDIGDILGKKRGGARSCLINVDNIVAPSYIRLMEAAGYDIKLRFVKR